MGLLGWLIAFVAFIGIEAATMALTTIWFAGGALVGLLFCLLGAGIEAQLLAFVVVSFALLILTRPLALRYVNQHTKKTNVEGLIGEKAYVTEEINNIKSKGAVKLKGLEWSARSENEDVIAADTEVVVKAVSGVKLIVSRL